MAEYIDREKLEADLNIRLSALREKNGYYDHYTDGFDECVDRVENFPAADVAPVKHGRWVDHCVRDWHCSECGEEINKIRHVDGYCYDDKPTYCPNCGAKMDLEDWQ